MYSTPPHILTLFYLESSRDCNNFESNKSESIENHQWRSLNPVPVLSVAVFTVLADQLELSLQTI